jgi:gliding motility-associated-like protein
MKIQLLLGLGLLFAFPIYGQLIHDYELNGTYADAFGGNPIVPNGGTLTATEYLFGPDQGPNVSGVINPETYCIELRFTPDLVSGWRKILDFKNRGSDNGLYILNGALQFYPHPPGGNVFVPGMPATVQFTRDGATKVMMGYVNGVLQWTITYTNNDATFTGPGNIIQILIDDIVVPGETNSGSLDYFKIADVGTIPLDLGGDVNAFCSYEIDPGLQGVVFEWSNGSSDPTLVVTTSGVYALTVTDGCNIGVDSIEVTITSNPPVDLGPATATICNGDSYDISLDPAIGDYVWQDGSTNSDYSITTPGLYQVTLDDGCGVSTDEINVSVLDAPDPFSLGADTILCAGDEIVFSFDPALGDFQWQDGSSSPNYVIDGGGFYELTISNMCGMFSDDLEVAEVPIPDVDLGPDQQLCAGESIDFDFDTNFGEYLWQDGTNSGSYSITNPGVYAVTMSNACGSASDQLIVDLISAPVFDLGDDITICPAQLPITLDVGNATNASFFEWQDGSANSQYQVTTSGSYSVTVSNDCFSVADQIEVFLEDAVPVVVLPPDQTLCPGQTFLLDASSISGNYLWQDNSTSSTLTVNQQGTYSLSVTNQCGTGSDSILINYLDSLSPPDLGPDINLCPGAQYIFYAGVPGLSYTWQDGSTADSLLVSSGGIYALTISDACTTAFDSVTVTISNNPPQVALPAFLSLCQSDTIIVDPGVSGVQFLWNDGSISSTLSITSPGEYSLTISNSCGTDADTIQILDAGSAPTVDLGQDFSLCPGDVNLIQPLSSGVNSWLWQDGSTSPTFTASAGGIISVQATNVCGISYDTVVVLSLPDVPILQLGSDTALCPGETFTLNISSPGVNILWSDGSTSTNFDVTGPGLFYASISNACGTSSDTIEVTSLPGVPTLDLGSDQSLCPGEVITLSPGISGVNYVWQDGSTAQTFNATQAGTIILTISNDCGAISDTVIISESTNGPQVDLGPDILECEGSVVTLSPGISGVSYLWQDGSVGPDYTTTSSGEIILTVSNNCGTDTDTVLVDISGVAPTPALGPDTVLCEGAKLILTSAADAETSIIWQDGSSASTFTVTAAGTYTLAVTNRCGDASDTIMVSYLDAPDPFTLGPDTILCPGESIVLTVPSTAFDILWQDGSHQLSMIADQAITYSLQLSNDCGTVTDSIRIEYDTRSPQLNLDSTIEWCEGDIINLDATQPFTAGYLWTTGETSSSIHVASPGQYGIQVTTPCNILSQMVDVVHGMDCIIPEVGISIPNVFSPNGDGINDFFSLSFGSDIQVLSITGTIYDRWGNLVFNSQSIPFIWDGTYAGEKVMPGVYVYTINVKYLELGREREKELMGDVTVMK